jgi:hypothetical protein
MARKLIPSDFISKYGCNDGDDEELVEKCESLLNKVCTRINKLNLPLKSGWIEIQTCHNPRRLCWYEGDEEYISFEDAPCSITEVAKDEIERFLDEVQ